MSLHQKAPISHLDPEAPFKSSESRHAQTTMLRANMRHAALGLAIAGALTALPAAAAVTFSGWNAGVSASSFGWSTDLFAQQWYGPPDIACVYAGANSTCANPSYPHGTTTPANLSVGTPIAG
jgi:hypothetical protein